MQNKNQKTTELSSVELLEMFQVEELDDRLEMCWVNCNDCTINSTTTNGTCCGNQTNGNPGINVPVNTACGGGPAPTTPGTK